MSLCFCLLFVVFVCVFIVSLPLTNQPGMLLKYALSHTVLAEVKDRGRAWEELRDLSPGGALPLYLPRRVGVHVEDSGETEAELAQVPAHQRPQREVAGRRGHHL